MKKVLLYPGAFNPPHCGHVSALKIAITNMNFDEVWILPSGNRDDKEIYTSYEDRRNLGKLFVESLASEVSIPVKLLTEELDNDNKKFTHEILREIKSQSDINITQLIGLDGILSLKEKMSTEHFIVVGRNGNDLPANLKDCKNLTILEETKQDISSTKIRNMIKENDSDYKNFLPKKIASYIQEKGLYLYS